MENISQIGAEFIEKNTSFPELISALKESFSKPGVLVPQRHHHDFFDQVNNTATTLLLMPAWHPGNIAGVKIVTINPGNSNHNLPTIQGTYIHIDAGTGSVQAILDARALTVKRTAATSALASSFLSHEKSSSMLMIGTGTLSADLIKAHASVRPLTDVFIWGRDFNKAVSVCELLQHGNFSAKPVKNIEDVISEVDIISSATLSKKPLVFGKYLRKGQHVDLVGSYKTDMREADDETIQKASVFVDTYEAGLKESGDIVIPVSYGIISKSDIKADLFDLCSGRKSGRTDPGDITLFKSVGYALEDLCAAEYYFNKFRNHPV